MHLVFSVFIAWHVDVFLSFTGWFGASFSKRKFFSLYGVVAFYSCTSILVGRLAFGLPIPFRITGGWFGNTYLCLLLVAPLVNASIEALVNKGWQVALAGWLGFAAVMFVNWFSCPSFIGLAAFDIHSHTLVQMVFVYYTVRLFRLFNLVDRVRFWHVMTVIGLYFCAIALFASVALAKAHVSGSVLRPDFVSFRTNYIAPHVIFVSIAVFFLFMKFLYLPSWLGSMCMRMAPNMFGVYLVHDTTCYGLVLRNWLGENLVGGGMGKSRNGGFHCVFSMF